MEFRIQRGKIIKAMDLIALLLVALQFDLFYIINTEFKLGQGVLLVFSFIIIMKYFKVRSCRKDTNCFIMVYLFFLLLTGAYQVSNFIGGSIVSAFLAERVLWVYIIFYFAFEKLMHKRKFNNERCILILKYAGIMQLSLYFLQWVLSNRVIFLHVLSGTRYGSARFYFSPILLILLFCFCVSNLFHNGKTVIKGNKTNILWALLIIAEILIVQKYRMTTVSIAVAVFCGVLLYRGKIDKWFVILSIGVILAVVLFNTQMGQDIIRSLMNAGTDNSVQGRSAWRVWAWQELKKRPLLGNGFVYSEESYRYGGQYVAKLYGWSFTPGDYGIFGFVYEYGFLGLLWFLLFVITQFRRAMYVWKHNRNYAYLMFLVFIIVDSYSELYWIMSNGLFALVIYVVMLKYECIYINSTQGYRLKHLGLRNGWKT